MSILKQKIARAVDLKRQKRKQRQRVFNTRITQTQRQNLDLRERDLSQKSQLRAQLAHHTSQNGLTSSASVMKNYSTAMIRFALSNLAKSFLQPLLDKWGINLNEFKEFVQSRKEQVNCIKGLRSMILSDNRDCQQIRGMKNVFKDISIIFIKFFSVNWIFNRKIIDKKTHLYYRFKILRRLRNPIHFTYLEDFSSETKKMR